jgi:ATP-dependent DNA ligase
MALPAPMLARLRSLPREDGYVFELKWDGFRAMVRMSDGFAIRSRRGWKVTPLVPELAPLPVDAVADAELVAPGEDGSPDLPLVCNRLPNARTSIPDLHRVRRARVRRADDKRLFACRSDAAHRALRLPRPNVRNVATPRFSRTGTVDEEQRRVLC